MNLAEALLRPNRPSMLRKPGTPFRFSHAVSEAGTYETDYGPWQPMILDRDPPVLTNDREKRSRRFYDAVLPHIPARAEMAWQVLLHSDAIEPEDWEVIEYCLAREGEDANGEDVCPKNRNARFRPRSRASVIDLGALFMVSAQKIKSAAKVVLQSDVPALYSDRPDRLPPLLEDA